MIPFVKYPAGLELCDGEGNTDIAFEGQTRSHHPYDDKPTGGMQNVFCMIAERVGDKPELDPVSNEMATAGIISGMLIMKARGLTYEQVLTLCESCVCETDFGKKGYT